LTPSQNDLAVEEYRALRATIRERGTMRLIVVAITFVAWAALVLAVQVFVPIPLFSLVPLFVLAAGFEVVFATHVGIERIGRYVQVRYETNESDLPAWERSAMALGAHARARTGIDPLASGLFIGAAALNLVPVLLVSLSEGPNVLGVIPAEFAVFAGIHVLFVWRIFKARRFAARQRAADLEIFREMLRGGHDA